MSTSKLFLKRILFFARAKTILYFVPRCHGTEKERTRRWRYTKSLRRNDERLLYAVRKHIYVRAIVLRASIPLFPTQKLPKRESCLSRNVLLYFSSTIAAVSYGTRVFMLPGRLCGRNIRRDLMQMRVSPFASQQRKVELSEWIYPCNGASLQLV